MTFEDAMKDSELANEITKKISDAKEEGITAERSRLQAIDKIATVVNKEMLENAKYEEPISAADLALKMATDSATSGKQYFNDALKDSEESKVNKVTTTPANPVGTAGAEDNADDALMSAAVNSVNSKRKEGK